MNDVGKKAEAMAVLQSLESAYITPAIRQAREKQDEILIQRFQGKPFAIADIGCGTGHHGLIFGSGCSSYHGFEISTEIAEIARLRWQQQGLDNCRIFLGDVTQTKLQDNFYDLVLCMYFTPGNFRDFSEDLSIYDDQYLDNNPVFIKIFSDFYQALKPAGLMFLTIYKDLPVTEAAQYDFYKKTGQHVVTPPGSRFVVTAENFWSVRWTRASLLSNLQGCGIAEKDVLFHDLNEIAWLIEIKK